MQSANWYQLHWLTQSFFCVCVWNTSSNWTWCCSHLFILLPWGTAFQLPHPPIFIMTVLYWFTVKSIHCNLGTQFEQAFTLTLINRTSQPTCDSIWLVWRNLIIAKTNSWCFSDRWNPFRLSASPSCKVYVSLVPPTSLPPSRTVMFVSVIPPLQTTWLMSLKSFLCVQGVTPLVVLLNGAKHTNTLT